MKHYNELGFNNMKKNILSAIFLFISINSYALRIGIDFTRDYFEQEILGKKEDCTIFLNPPSSEDFNSAWHLKLKENDTNFYTYRDAWRICKIYDLLQIVAEESKKGNLVIHNKNDLFFIGINQENINLNKENKELNFKKNNQSNKNTNTLFISLENGKTIEKSFEKSTNFLIFRFADMGIDNPIVQISVLEELHDLESVEFHNITVKDSHFFTKCKQLKKLTFVNCRLDDLKFIEQMESLETIYLGLYIDNAKYDDFIKTKINLSKLNQLSNIYFKVEIIKDGTLLQNNIKPNFYNMPSECKLTIVNE